jgi:L-aspartate semialdehyde sulfurtransferase ferredoxin
MATPKKSTRARFAKPQTTRLWLMYPPKLIQKPVIWELTHKFNLVTNVRQASVTDEIGIVCLELEGAPEEVEAGMKWLKKLGVSVEPVELSAMES